MHKANRASHIRQYCGQLRALRPAPPPDRKLGPPPLHGVLASSAPAPPRHPPRPTSGPRAHELRRRDGAESAGAGARAARGGHVCGRRVPSICAGRRRKKKESARRRGRARCEDGWGRGAGRWWIGRLGRWGCVSGVRKWLEGQVGKARDSSYELSNITVFDPEERREGQGGWTVDLMVFSQPADMTSCPVNFSVISVNGGDIAVILTWQRGVLSVEGESEDDRAGRVCKRLENDMANLVGF